MVQPGASVAVFGAGPVGLLAAYSALLQGAAQVFVVDYIPERLDLVKNIGAIPIDFTKSDPVAQIKAILSEKRERQSQCRQKSRKWQKSWVT